MWKDIFIRASPSDLVNASRRFQTENDDDDKIQLKRVFRLFDLIIFGISCTVGSGIFIIAGTAGKSYAGSSLVLSLIIGGFSQMCTSFAHAEFASRIPIIGSVYTYNYNSSGEFIAFLMAWQGILDPLSASINAIGATGYFKSFLVSCGISRQNLDNSVWFGYRKTDDSLISINLAAPLLILILSLFALFDVGLSKNFMNYFTVWNISLLFLFILCGSFLVVPDIWIHPCNHVEFGVECPSDANNSFFPYGFDGMLHGSLIASWAFMGVEQIVTVAEECVHPIRDIPRGIYISLLIVTLLYVAVVMIINGCVPFQALDVDASLAESLAAHGELALHKMISLGAASTMSVLSFASLIGSTRRWFRVGVDGLCFPMFSYIHPKFRTPFYVILLYTIIGMTAAMFFDITSILSFGSISLLLNYTSVSIGVLIVRYSPPSYEDNSDAVGYWWNETKMIGLTWGYLLIALIFAYIEVNRDYFKIKGIFGLWITFIVIFVIILVVLTGLFCYFHYRYPWRRWVDKLRTYEDGKSRNNKIYYMPFCPYLPCLLILLNSYMIAGMGLKMMGELIIVLALGVPIYFGYSYKHSQLRKQKVTQQVSSMIALTSVNDPIQDEIDDPVFKETVETAIT